MRHVEKMGKAGLQGGGAGDPMFLVQNESIGRRSPVNFIEGSIHGNSKNCMEYGMESHSYYSEQQVPLRLTLCDNIKLAAQKLSYFTVLHRKA